MTPAPSYTRLLAKHIASRSRHRPLQALDLGKRLILDSLGNAIAGTATDVGKSVLEYSDDFVPSGSDASIISRPLKAATKDAAFVNTQLAILLDMDETYRNAGHPGSPIVFAALAAAEKSGATGSRYLNAVVDAYDVAARLIDAIRPTLAQENRGRSPFGCADAFGPGIAAAIVLELNEEETYHTLGLSGANARLPISLKSNEPPMSPMKSSQAWHAEHGIRAAELASKGFTGPHDILDGSNGFWSAAGTDQWIPEQLVDGLGERYCITNISFKAQPVCRLIHPAIEAVMAIVGEHNLLHAEIEHILVHTLSRLTRPEYAYANTRPTDMVSAQFSFPFAIALALRGTTPGGAWYQRGIYEEPEVVQLASKVEICEDRNGTIDQYYDEDMLHNSAKVTVRARGREFSHATEYAWGDPAKPFTQAEIEDKFRLMVNGIITDGAARQIVHLSRRLETLGDVRELTDMLRAG
jgi:2-methylcitrate dehydratase PrpD